MQARPETIKLAIEATERSNKLLASLPPTTVGVCGGGMCLKLQNKQILKKLKKMLEESK